MKCGDLFWINAQIFSENLKYKSSGIFGFPHVYVD